MRIGILNVVESGHRVIDAIKPAVLEFLGGKVVAAGNLFADVVDLSNVEKTLQETITRVDAALEHMLPRIDVLVFVFSGPYIVAYTAAQRVLRRAAYKIVLLAQFDVANKRYLFVEDSELFRILHGGAERE